MVVRISSSIHFRSIPERPPREVLASLTRGTKRASGRNQQRPAERRRRDLRLPSYGRIDRANAPRLENGESTRLSRDQSRRARGPGKNDGKESPRVKKFRHLRQKTT